MAGSRSSTRIAQATARASNAQQGGGDGGGGDGDGGGGGGGPPPAQGQQAAPQQPVQFSLTPGLARQGTVLDLSTKQGYYHYTGATDKLEEDLYDCTPDGFYQFIKSLGTRAKSYGWTNPGGIFWVSPTPNAQAHNPPHREPAKRPRFPPKP